MLGASATQSGAGPSQGPSQDPSQDPNQTDADRLAVFFLPIFRTVFVIIFRTYLGFSLFILTKWE
ncbi:hypothetical protein AFM18_09365 [Achromobacter spanius]|uniref:Uncharacterized protein n=1 Tax=Achromobacter spanius TaxID=217203 RepID=A0AAW3I564_9BURK|nr:hypothetical protein AFM18_09365 [Achromobacter spanius]